MADLVIVKDWMHLYTWWVFAPADDYGLNWVRYKLC
jgi:hypothetical protein